MDEAASVRPTERFTTRAGVYAAHRPGYPPECVALLGGMVSSLGWGVPRRIADIGAGTGLLTRSLAAECGVVAGFEGIDAVEPNAAMRAAGQARAGEPGAGSIVWHDATGESTGLGRGSVGLVVCAQAFHWLVAGAAMEEFARILAGGDRGAGGAAALVWNAVADDDAGSAGYRGVLERHASEPPRSPREGSVERMAQEAFAGAGAAFGPATVWRFAHEQRLDEEGLLGRAFSASYVPHADTAGGAALAAALRALHAAHADDGVMALRYRTIAVVAARRGG